MDNPPPFPFAMLSFVECAALLLTLSLPLIIEHMTTAVILKIYAAEGTALIPGAKLLDLSVDLSRSIPHDCPPISHFRLAVRERVWLRRLTVMQGGEFEVGASIGKFSTEPDEPFDGEPSRAVRITVAGILHHADWWSEETP